MDAVILTILLLAITVAIGGILAVWLTNISPPSLIAVCKERCAARGMEYNSYYPSSRMCFCERCRNVTAFNNIYGECQLSDSFIIEPR